MINELIRKLDNHKMSASSVYSETQTYHLI